MKQNENLFKKNLNSFDLLNSKYENKPPIAIQSILKDNQNSRIKFLKGIKFKKFVNSKNLKVK